MWRQDSVGCRQAVAALSSAPERQAVQRFQVIGLVLMYARTYHHGLEVDGGGCRGGERYDLVAEW